MHWVSNDSNEERITLIICIRRMPDAASWWTHCLWHVLRVDLLDV